MKMSKKRVDVFLSRENLVQLWDYMPTIGKNNESQAVEYIIKDYFQEESEEMKINKLKKEVTEKELKIQNLEYELKLLKQRPIIHESLSHEVK